MLFPNKIDILLKRSRF